MTANDVPARTRAVIYQLLTRPGAVTVPQLRLELVARELHMSRRTLQRRLSEADSSFRSCVDAERMRVAREMLADTDRYIEDIAFRLHYRNRASFNVAFRRLYGITPSAYRRQCRKEREIEPA